MVESQQQQLLLLCKSHAEGVTMGGERLSRCVFVRGQWIVKKKIKTNAAPPSLRGMPSTVGHTAVRPNERIS